MTDQPTPQPKMAFTEWLSQRVVGIANRHLVARWDRFRFRRRLRHLSGPTGPSGQTDDVTVIALMKDGGYYLDVFLDHYRRLGAAHFVFCDTGSTDGAIERLAQEPDVTVLQCTLPWGRFENIFRNHAAHQFAQDRWCLFADMDEILELGDSRDATLPAITRQLDRLGYTALMAQMLEMFPDGPLAQTAQLPYREVQSEFIHYDISTVAQLPYASEATGLSGLLRMNQLPPSSPPYMQFGGIRARVFGEHCCLSKHPLVKVVDGVAPAIHPHISTGVRVADRMALLKHYKFANDPIQRDQETQAAATIKHGEDGLRLAGFADNPDLSLWSETAQTYAGLQPLLAARFLQGKAAHQPEDTP